MKKFWTIALSLALALSLVACGVQKSAEENGEEEKEYAVMDFTEVEGVTHYTHRHTESHYGSGEFAYSTYEDETCGYADGITDPLFIRNIADNGYSQENLYTYTQDGKMLTWRYRNCEGATSYREYEYQGELLMKTVEEQDGEVITTFSHYNDAGDFIGSEEYHGDSDVPYSTEVWEWENGLNVRTISQSGDGSRSVVEYEYEGENPVRYTQTYTDPDGTQSVSVTENEYDAHGRVIRSTDTDSEGSVTTYEYEYDEYGQEIKSVYTGTDDYGYTRETTYDGNGNVLTCVTTYLDGEVETEENEYDEQGRVVREHSIQTSGESVYESENTYVYE